MARRRYVNLLKRGAPPWETYDVQWESPDGAYSVVEVQTQWDFELEGYFLAHCLGTKDADDFNKAHRVFSLRDRLSYPHATLLLLRDGEFSPYGAGSDLLTDYCMKLPTKVGKHVKDLKYSVLQVRGREDRIARWEFYALVRQWFRAHGGKFPSAISEAAVRKAIARYQDTDIKYHYGYMLDESNNYFNWAYWNREMAAWMERQGKVKL